MYKIIQSNNTSTIEHVRTKRHEINQKNYHITKITQDGTIILTDNMLLRRAHAPFIRYSRSLII